MRSGRPTTISCAFALLVLQSCTAKTPTRDAVSAITGLTWPQDQVFPSFGTIADLDVVDLAGLAKDQITLLVTLEGLVNRTRPRIYVLDGAEGKRFWLDQLGVSTHEVSDPLVLVSKYASEIGGIVIYDDTQIDTLNLATTLAGLQGGVVASPALAPTLTAAPYHLNVLADLRTNHFASKLDVYAYQLDQLGGAATHRLIIGLNPQIAGDLRDYAVATHALTVWLDPRDAGEQDMLSRYLRLLSPNSPYLGWWANEPAGVHAASSFGVPVYAADFSENLTVLGGVPHIPPPPASSAPPPPPLENKVYVAIFMSDGDNLQEDQHLIPRKWADANRGRVPIGWTIDPALVDVAPTILDYFHKTSTPNDVLVSGPSGLGYTYPAAWPSAQFERYAETSARYLDAAGLRVITVWNNGVELSEENAHAYAAHMPNLLGLTIQDAAEPLRIVDGRVPLIRLAKAYGSTEADLESGIDGELAGWSRTQPLFIAVQGDMNQSAITPTAFADVAQHYAANGNVVFVRPDHFFELLQASTAERQHQLFTGDFDGDGRTDLMFYELVSHGLWMGLSDGHAFAWHLADASPGFGNLVDASHRFMTGDFDGDGKTDLLFYYAGDGTWWMGRSDGNAIAWSSAGNTKGFGDLLDGRHPMFVGDLDGDQKTDVLFYSAADGNWWMGISDGHALSWRLAGNVSGFGDLTDPSRRLFTGDFNGDRKMDVLFFNTGDGNWWMGLSDGSALAWHVAGNTKGFGSILDQSHALLSGDFDGDSRTDVALYSASDGNWWFGRSNGDTLSWNLAGNAKGFGDLVDSNHGLWSGDFDGDGKSDVGFYFAGDGRWWIGRSDGSTLAWNLASTVPGFGNLLDPSRRVFTGDFDGDRKSDLLFYYDGDGNWWSGASGGVTLDWHLAGNTMRFGDLLR
jgi:hypothetical protein